MQKKDLTRPTIIIDSREQDPYFLRDTKTECSTKIAKLDCGDYSVEGFETRVAVERKSILDACGTLGNGRDRFKREMERMNELMFAAIIIESSLIDFVNYIKSDETRPQINPKAAIQTLIAFSVRYDVHVIWAENRKFAARYTESILMKFYKYAVGNQICPD